MHQDITPIAVRPWTLNGISERMIVSHYENNYGGAVRTLNAIRSELAGLETSFEIVSVHDGRLERIRQAF